MDQIHTFSGPVTPGVHVNMGQTEAYQLDDAADAALPNLEAPPFAEPAAPSAMTNAIIGGVIGAGLSALAIGLGYWAAKRRQKALEEAVAKVAAEASGKPAQGMPRAANVA